MVRRYELSGELTPEHARGVVDLWSAMRIVRHAPYEFMERIWELRHNFTTYDAAYVALAELLAVPLITSDARLARSKGHRARVELFR